MPQTVSKTLELQRFWRFYFARFLASNLPVSTDLHPLDV
jgi:hypothetical protein